MLTTPKNVSIKNRRMITYINNHAITVDATKYVSV